MPGFSRRDFLATTTALGAVGAFAQLMPRPAYGASVLNARMSRDIDILDPGYMVGGSEIDLQQAVMPTLVEYTYEGGALGWKPTAYVKEIGHRDPTHIDFTLNSGFQWTGGNGELTAEDVKYSLRKRA